MARATGPLGSQAAHGSLAGVLTYSNWKGRNTVRLISRPRDPRSGLQIGTRAMAKFITEQWTPRLSQAQKDTWLELAAADQLAAINAYQAFNLTRWGINRFPSKTPAVNDTGGGSVPRTGLTAIGGVGQATVNWNTSIPGSVWGTKIHRGTSNTFTSTRDNVVGVINEQDNGAHSFTEKNVPPGTWWYRLAAFRTDGGSMAQSVRVSAVVT